MISGVQIEGMADFRRALREAADATPRELTKVLGEGSKLLRSRAQQNLAAIAGPRSAGRTAGSLRLYTRAKEAGFISSLPQAGVREFARTYRRRSRSQGGRSHTVTMKAGGSTPRFGYKALDQLESQLTKLAFDAFVDVARAHGWFVD